MRTMAKLFTSLVLSFVLNSCLMASDSTQTTGSAEASKSTEKIEKAKIDEDTGFIIDEHWELAKTHCTACHSARLVTAQRGTKQMWLEMIHWMQSTQGLWKFDQETEENLLNYLAKNYAPEENYRRMPISPDLMP